MPKLSVTFDVKNEAEFHEQLKRTFEHDDNVTGLRTDAPTSQYQTPLQDFLRRMEAKLVKNSHKTDWRDLPIEALYELMEIEIREFRVAIKYKSVAEARSELVDIANFALILDDRLSVEPQKEKAKANIP